MNAKTTETPAGTATQLAGYIAFWKKSGGLTEAGATPAECFSNLIAAVGKPCDCGDYNNDRCPEAHMHFTAEDLDYVPATAAAMADPHAAVRVDAVLTTEAEAHAYRVCLLHEHISHYAAKIKEILAHPDFNQGNKPSPQHSRYIQEILDAKCALADLDEDV